MRCTQTVVNLDEDPDNADWLKTFRKKPRKENGK